MRTSLVALALLGLCWAAPESSLAAPAAGTTTVTDNVSAVSAARVGNQTSVSAVSRTKTTVKTPPAPAKPKAKPKHRTVAAQRPSDATAASVAHNFAIPHPLPFLRGLKDNHELAQKIRDNLAAHPDGNSPLDPAQCRANGSCAAPNWWLISYQYTKKDLTLAGLADFVDSFKPHVLTAEEAVQQWDMDCGQRLSDGSYKVVINCGNRQFHKGEIAYVDPASGRFLMANDCANPVRGIHHEPAAVIVQSNCAEIDFETRPGDTAVRIFILGPPVKDACEPAIQPAGEDDYLPGWFDQCASVLCNGRAIEAATGQTIERRASYYTTTAGHHRIRVPLSFTQPGSPNAVVLCLDRGGQHSDAQRVRGGDYRRIGALPVATVYYARNEVPGGAPDLYWPWREWNGR